jgi:hypothetical protein
MRALLRLLIPVTPFLALAFAAAPAGATIGVAKDATISGREVTLDFYLENLGVSTLNPVALLDDLDAAFGAGNYTVTSGPVLVVDPGTLSVNNSFDGSADVVLIDDGTLAPGATAQVRIVVEVNAVTDQGFGLGVYFNQATAEGDEGTFSDLSDDGTDPDPDGNGDPTGMGEDDPTLVDLTQNPLLGAAKAATLDGSEVTFDFYLGNFGNRTLSSLTLTDDLDAVFGAGNYSVTTGPTLIDDPGTIMVNGGFDGGGDVDLIASGSLAVGATARIRVVVDVTTVTDRGAGLGVYSNQATAAAVSPSGTPTSDLSDAGIDPDPRLPGSDDPTVFVIGEEPVLGVAKNAVVAVSDVTFDYYLENLGAVALATLSLADDLDAVFGAGNYAVTSPPTLVDDPGTITLNALFDGSLETALVSAGTLAAGDTAQVRVVVHVFALADLGSGLGVYENQVTAAGTTAAGAVTSDLSDAGTDPDPGGDGDPTGAGEDDPTAFAVAQNPVIGAAKTAGVVRLGANYQISLTFFLVNLGNVPLADVSLTDDLDAVFGAGNYGSVTDPQVALGGGGALGGNNAFNGATDTELLAAGGTMDPGAVATIEVRLTLTNVTDQGFGVGIYRNQATANAEGPAGAAPADLSDSGDVPDPDDDGDPSEAGEDDPTEINVGTFVGAAKDAMVSGNEVTFDFYLEAFGTETITSLELSESLDGVLGVGNYTVTTGPSLEDDPGTLAVNPGFDGSSDAELLAPGGSLAAGDTAQVRIVVTVHSLINGGLGLGAYVNQAQVFGETPGGTPLNDLSHAGTDPDPNGDGNPTTENTPTTFTIVVDPIIGVAKDAAVSGTQVTLDFYLESFGTLPSGELDLSDDLDAAFGAGNYTILTGPTFIDDPGTLVLNGAYDGSGDPQLLLASSTLNAGDTAQIRVVVDVTEVTDQGFGSGVYQNQATLTGSDASGLVYSDLSAWGTDPDANGNGDPTQPASENEPTIIVIGRTQIAISKQAIVNGTDVTLDFYVENVGDVEVSALFMEEDLAVLFGSGNFAIITSPQVIEGANTISISPQWFGFNVFRVLITGGTLAPGASARIRTVVQVTNVTDRGDGLGVYFNQVTITGEGPDGTPTADDSDAGIVPDADGDGDPTEAGENDPTPIIIGEEAILGVAKDAGVAASQVTFDYYLENLGNVTLDTLDLEDDLDAVFGAGNYGLNGAPFLVDDPGTLMLDPAYDGSASIDLIAAGSTLAAADTAQIRLVVDVLAVVDQGLGRGSYENQVLVSGLAPMGSVAMDFSDDGFDPDPNGDGDPTSVGEGDPTAFSVSIVAIGAAKAAAVIGRVVTLDYYVENLGSETLTEVSLPDDLDAVFGAGTYQILSGPTLVTEVHDLAPNPGFNGSGDTALLLAGGSIVAGGFEQLRVVVRVDVLTDQGSGLGVYSNQVTVSAEDPGGAQLSDLSDAGTDPDPDGDGDASETGEDDPTIFSVAEDPTVGVAKTASVSGGTVTLDLFLESFANVAASVALTDDLDAVFGAGNYTVTSAPSLIVNPGTLVVNGGFDGSGDTALLAGGSTLSVGAVAQLRVVAEVVQVTDRGSGLGVYQNQASLTAAGPVAAVAADLSDAGTDPDPDGDGQPNEAGENDPTPIVLTDAVPPAVTGVATNLGALAECDTLRQPVTALTVTIEDDLTSVVNADAASSYLLVEAGPDADFSTLACGGAAGDDVEIAIASLSLTSVDPVVVDVDLGLAPAGLAAGLYRFFVCDTVTDDFGNALDGDGDAVAGGDFVVPFFRADPGNLLLNGHFDDCPVSLDPWLQVTGAPNTIEPGDAGTDDYQASPFSASARISHSVDDTSSLAQCVAVTGGVTYDLESRLRFDPPLGAAAIFSRTCEFFAGAGCTGASLATSTDVSLIEDTGGLWLAVTRPIAVPDGALSALCDFTFGGDPSFDVYLDGLRLVGSEVPIFADGFESGDTTAWSSTVP